jgi:hypothetical protein
MILDVIVAILFVQTPPYQSCARVVTEKARKGQAKRG